MTTDFSKTPPLAPKGVPFDLIHFSGGRTGMTLAGHGGIIHLFHYARQPLDGVSFFKSSFPHSSWVKIFRLAVVIDGVSYYPEYHQTRIYPFGYTTTCSFKGVRLAYEIVLLNDALVQRVRVLSNPRGRRLELKVMLHGFTAVQKSFRTWEPWKLDHHTGNVVAVVRDSVSPEEGRRQVQERKLNPVQYHTFEFPDVAEAQTHIGLGSTCGLEYSSVDGAHEGFKKYLTTGPFEEQAAFFVCFQSSAADILARSRQLNESVFSECDDLLESYAKRIASAPQLNLQSPVLRSCLENIPPILDSLKTPDIPGGMRAAAHGYWIWSWDSLVYAEAYLFANDASFLRDILLLTKGYADPVLGIPHQLTTQLDPQLAMAFSAQCLFIVALYNYYCHTGDQETLKACYPLASWILKKCLETEVADTGLVEGVSLYPDYPGLLDQQGKDISVFNNSVFYQGVMSMRYLAQEMHALSSSETDRDLSMFCSDLAERTRENFVRHFFDETAGYFVDSVSSEDFSKRKYYPVYAILWVTPFAADLLGGHEKRIAAFMTKNFTRPHGLGMFPVWDPAYLRDGNQFGAYYPVVETLYRNVMKLAGRSKELGLWLDNVEWYWSRHTIPEGITYEAENEEPDNPGTKQAFAAKAWYDIFFRTILGLEVEERGVVFSLSPVACKASVKNIFIRGKRLDLNFSGGGPDIRATFNGTLVGKLPLLIPFSRLKKINTFTLTRSGGKKKTER